MEAGCTLWFTGMSGSGKSTLSSLVADRLRALGARVEVIDGDVVRTQLCKGLGFSKDDRQENIAASASFANCSRVTASSPSRRRFLPIAHAARNCDPGSENFIEIYMRCPVDVLVERDVKGLYKKALAGEIPHFTGISDPYEPPAAPGSDRRLFQGRPGRQRCRYSARSRSSWDHRPATRVRLRQSG